MARTDTTPLLNRRLDLNLLELFDVVYRHRNLTRAADELGLSQPAVSYGIARLRAVYADPLFVRMRRGVLPTPAADRLAQPVGTALAALRATIDKPVFDPATAARTFRIVMTDIGERYFLPLLSSWLSRHAPGVIVQTVSLGLEEMAEGLANGEIDLAIGYLPGLGKQAHQETLFVERFVYLVRSGHPAAGGAITLRQLRLFRHVLAGPPGQHHRLAVEKVLSGPRVRAPIALRVQSFLAVGPIVAETDLVAVVPSNLAAVLTRTLDVRACPPPVPFPDFDLSMHWHGRVHQDPASLWLRGVVRQLFGNAEARRGRSRASRRTTR